jgi:hypothetical protein
VRGQLQGEARRAFMLAGDATFTIASPKTGVRYTYRVTAKREGGKLLADEDIRFVKLLCGPDNDSDFHYFGIIRPARAVYEHAKRKTRIRPDAPGAMAFRWLLAGNASEVGPLVWPLIDAHVESAPVGFYHEGRCGRCGRKLTVPESVSSGFGPECINHVHG